MYTPFFADVNCNNTIVSCSSLPQPDTSTSLNTILGIVFAITASIALLMIVIAGFRYMLASGDPKGTAEARNTIIYAVVGLLISMAAFSIVTFVIKGVG